MSRKKEEAVTEKIEHEKYNNVTQKRKVENQNQTHNVVREGIGPENQRR